ncbi:MAG: hypothetical protein OXU23_28280, partial [Candidatus Poribacteria bacterium]|nr:hypothetical protein [Candidatus Poribacteria bacterium]
DNDWADAEEDQVSLDNVYLRIDGEKVAFASDDVIFTEAKAKAEYTANNNDKAIETTITFDDEFEIDVRGKQEVIFEIVADLDSAWSHFDGTQVEFELTSVDRAEGLSSEKDFTGTGEFFATAKTFTAVDIIGNVIEFEITDGGVDDTSRVAGSEDVTFGTIVVDATDAVDTIEMKDVWLSFTPSANGDLGDIDNCRITESGDQIADARGTLSGTTEDQIRFKFDDYVVDAGAEVDLEVVCDIDDDAAADHEYTLATAVPDPDPRIDKIEYLIGNDEFEYVFKEGDDSKTIAVSASGTLEVSFDNPDEDADVFPVAVGDRGVDNIPVLEIEFEAEEEDARIIDLYLAGITLPAGTTAASEATLEKLMDSVWFEIGGNKQTARPRDFVERKKFDDASDSFDSNADNSVTDAEKTKTNLLEFESVNETMPVDEEEVVVLKVDLAGIDENNGQAGQYLQAAEVVIVWEGRESEEENTDLYPISAGTFSKAIAFPTVPTVSVPSQPSSAGNLTDGNDKELYRFTVTADDEGDLYLGQVAFDINVTNGVTLSNVELRRGSTTLVAASGTITANAANKKFDFSAKVQEIQRGESRTFSLYATIAGSADDKSVTVELSDDGEPAAAAKVGRTFTATKADSNFVWSPNAKDEDGSIEAANTDWFGSWSLYKNSEIESWTRD